jgi:hypothetical protein
VKLYDHVRIKKEVPPSARSNGWALNQRAPQVGDSGAVVEVLSIPGEPELYVVECVDGAGRTVWLEEFTADEIERIEPNA